MQHKINEQKDKTLNVQIILNIESSAVTETSTNLMINASKNETFNTHSIISFNIEINEQFSILLDILNATESSTITKTLINNVFKHRLISLNETFPTENIDTNINVQSTSNATNLSDEIEHNLFKNATDQISDNFSNN